MSTVRSASIRNLVTEDMHLAVAVAMTDGYIWSSLFPQESPANVVSSAWPDAQPDELITSRSVEHLARWLWLELFDDAERSVFCDQLGKMMDDGDWFPFDIMGEIDDAFVIRSMARTIYHYGGLSE